MVFKVFVRETKANHSQWIRFLYLSEHDSSLIFSINAPSSQSPGQEKDKLTFNAVVNCSSPQYRVTFDELPTLDRFEFFLLGNSLAVCLWAYQNNLKDWSVQRWKINLEKRNSQSAGARANNLKRFDQFTPAKS